jgi:acetolactate synthase I/II/III large subunit
MLFHEAIARVLADQGITTIFGVLGDANLYMMDSFQRHAGGRYVSVSNEAGAVLAANGFARTSGGLGVATVTHGPALTNTATALVESVKDRTPVLVVAGDTAVADAYNLQKIQQREVVHATGAGFEQVRTPQTVMEDVAVAVRRAMLERRPIVLNVPIEFQWEQVEYHRAKPRFVKPQAIGPDPAALDEAVGIVAAASRPVVLAGRGATAPEARAALIRLAERIGAPLATTLRAKELFRGHRHDLGIFGTLSHKFALEAIMQSDCVIAFGAGLNSWTTADGSLLDKKALVHVDADPLAIHRFSAGDAGVVGDTAIVADQIVSWLDIAEVQATRFANDALAQRLTSYTDTDFRDLSTEQTVDLRTALTRLDTTFPADRTLAFDGGRWIFEASTRLHVPNPQAYVHTVNFGSIGLGMGNAVGAYFGAPERPVLLITGDGGFMMGGLAEFSTAVRYGVDLVVVLFNDSAYGAEHVQFRNKDMDPSITTFEWPDFGPVATALGGRGFTVRNLAELDAAYAAIADRDRPVLIDVKIDPDKVPSGGH